MIMNYIYVLVLIVVIHYQIDNVNAEAKGDYTEEEKNALEEFRNEVDEVLYRDFMKKDKYLIRWLRTKNLNVADASEMIRTAMKWRQENKIDSILNETILEFPAPPYYVDGFSFYGRPIMSLDLGRINMRKFVTAGKRKELIRYIDQMCEISEQGLIVIGNVFDRYEITQGILIVDLSGYSLRQHACIGCLSIHRQWLHHIENYFPGLIKFLFFINTPRIYRPILELVRSTLSSPTLKGLHVYGRNKEEWSAALLKLIPPNQIRKQFGGTKPEEVLCNPQDYACHYAVFFRKPINGTAIEFN